MRKVTRTDLKAIRADLTADELTQILDLHHEVVNEFKEYVSPADHAKVVTERDTLKNAPKPEALLTDKEVTELAELRTYKTNTETAKTTESKTAALTKSLTEAKCDPKAIKLLLKGFDINAVELDDKGGVKNFDTLVEPVKTEYADYFGVEVVKGFEPGKATIGKQGKADPFADVLETYKENAKK